MRSKTYMSKINLQSGILTVENRRSREKKRICSYVERDNKIITGKRTGKVQCKYRKCPACVGP